jgi:hypothetical protein
MEFGSACRKATFVGSSPLTPATQSNLCGAIRAPAAGSPSSRKSHAVGYDPWRPVVSVGMMLDHPAKTPRLLAALKAAAPFEVELAPSLIDHLQAENVANVD